MNTLSKSGKRISSLLFIIILISSLLFSAAQAGSDAAGPLQESQDEADTVDIPQDMPDVNPGPDTDEGAGSGGIGEGVIEDIEHDDQNSSQAPTEGLPDPEDNSSYPDAENVTFQYDENSSGSINSTAPSVNNQTSDTSNASYDALDPADQGTGNLGNGQGSIEEWADHDPESQPDVQHKQTPDTNSTVKRSWATIDITKLDPELAKYVLLTELDSINFGVKTDKLVYAPDENIWATIIAPQNADVELSFDYDGIKQYIKIPKEKSFPYRYLLPIPRNIKDGVYTLSIATYYLGIPLKTYTMFQVSGDKDTKDPTADGELQSSKVRDPGITDHGAEHVTSSYEQNKPQLNPDTTLPAYDTVDYNGLTLNEEKDTRQMQAEIRKPVRWVKDVKITNTNSADPDAQIIVGLPDDAKNIKVIDMNLNKAVDDVQDYDDSIAISVDLSPREEKHLSVQFETDPPHVEESQPIENGTVWKKQITISSEYHYRDIFSYTDIKDTDADSIRLYWYVDGVKTDVTHDESFDLRFYDLNNNGKVDRISWITPHLSTQTFEVVILVNPDPSGFQNSIDITLKSPINNSFVKNTDAEFMFNVEYNSTFSELLCSLYVDDVAVAQNINSTDETMMNVSQEFEEGNHRWYVSCSNNKGIEVQSEIWSFITDYTPPTVHILDNNMLSLIDTINLSFEASDNIAETLNCYINISGESYSRNLGDIVLDGVSSYSNLVAGIPNGTYRWNVTCIDSALLKGTSSTGIFSIDTQRNFSFSTNKDVYAINEQGYFIVTAPSGSEVVVLFTNPHAQTTMKRYYNQSLVVEPIPQTDIAGKYLIEAVLNYKGVLKKISDSYKVDSMMFAKIYPSTTDAGLNEKIVFKSDAGGGVGPLSYSWDLGDNSPTLTGSRVEHSYSRTGSYTVHLTVTDSVGNKVESETSIDVREPIDFKFKVMNKLSNDPVKGAAVIFDDTEKYTDNNGLASYRTLYGEYDFYVRHPDFHLFKGIVFIDKNKTVDVFITPKDNSTYNITNSSSSSSSNSPVSPSSSDPASQASESTESTAASSNPVQSQSEEDLGTESHFADLIEKLSIAEKNVNKYKGDKRKILDILGVETKLSAVKKNIARANRDFFNLKKNWRRLNESELKKEKDDLIRSVRSLEKTTIMELNVKDSGKLVFKADDPDVSFISKRYADSYNVSLTDEELKKYVSINQKLNSVPVTFEYYIVRVKYLNGKRDTFTVMLSDNISVSSDKESFVIYVPLETADTSDVMFLGEHVNQVAGNILEFDVSRNPFIGFYFKKGLSSDDIKNIKGAFVNPDIENLEGGGILGITASSVFMKLSDMNIGDPKLFIEISLIVILLIIYLVYQFDLIAKLREFNILKLVDRELRDMHTLITKAYDYLDDGDVEKAEELHKGIMLAYTNLDKKKQEKIYPETLKLYDEINIEKIREIAKESKKKVKRNEHDVAKSHYKEIKELYSRLSKKAKIRVVNECMELFESLRSVSGQA